MSTKTLLVVLFSLALAVPSALRAADDKSDKGTDSKKASAKSKADAKTDAKADAAKSDDKADDTLKGRLPPGYAKIVDATQKQKIYGIQAKYASQIDALQKQLDDLVAKEKSDIRAVLTADQQKKLDEAVGDTSKAKSSKKAADSKSDADMKKSNS